MWPIYCLFVIFFNTVGVYNADARRENLSHPVKSEVRADPEPTWNKTDSLIESLLVKYDKFALPKLDGVIEVKLTLNLNHIKISESESVVTARGFMNLEWKDSRLLWNSTEYGNIPSVPIPPTEIWNPDISLKNNVQGTEESEISDSIHCMIRSDGTVTWIVPETFQSFCDFDLTKWPFDTNTCELTFGSWSHDSSVLNITTNPASKFHTSLGEIELISAKLSTRTTSTKEKAETVFVDAICELTIRRRPGSVKAVVITPALVIAILCLASFFVPPQAGEKIVLSGVNALLCCLFLNYFAHSLSDLTDKTPHVVSFYSWSLYLVCFSIMVSVVTLNLARQPHPKMIPVALKNILTGSVGTVLLLSGYIEKTVVDISQNLDDAEVEGSSELDVRNIKATSARKDVELLAAAIDRIAFIICLICFIIFTGFFLC